MLNYEEFVRTITEIAEARTGNHAVVHKVKKVNGFYEDGLVIINPDCNISPTIYLRPYYELYKEMMDTEDEPVELVWNEIYSLYRNNMPVADFDLNDFRNYESIKEKLGIRIVNYFKNIELLDELVFVEFMDLAILFIVNVSMGKEVGAITIRKEHLALWGKTEEELMEQALVNIKDDYEIVPITEMLMRIAGEIELEKDIDLPIYVMSNYSKVNGASTILCRGVLKEFAEKHNVSKVVIIPSSLHEVLLMPWNEDADIEYLNSMVQEVNETVLDAREILSEHVYVYNNVTEKIDMC